VPSRLGLVISRAKSLDGPWETRDQVDDTTGGHQGALVDLPGGDWYGFVMRDSGSIGRTTNLSPVFWQDDWPVWGTPEAPGRVPAASVKPVQGFPVVTPAASDDFSSPRLGLQWQWNHNPDDSRWSLTERPGFLRLHATATNGIWTARNTLTQKGQGPVSQGVVKLDIGHVDVGDRCGFGTFGKFSGLISVSGAQNGHHTLSMMLTEATTGDPKTEVRVASVSVKPSVLWLRTRMDYKTSLARVDYSLDGMAWQNLGGDFPLAYDWRAGTFQGESYAIFCFSAGDSNGYMDVDSFTLSAGA